MADPVDYAEKQDPDQLAQSQSPSLSPSDNPHTAENAPRNVSVPQTPQTSPIPTLWNRGLNILLWTPPWCRWDPENPPKFGLPLNFLFAFAGTFTVRRFWYQLFPLGHLTEFHGWHFHSISAHYRSQIYITHIQFWMTWLITLMSLKNELLLSQLAVRRAMRRESSSCAHWAILFGEDISWFYWPLSLRHCGLDCVLPARSTFFSAWTFWPQSRQSHQ